MTTLNFILHMLFYASVVYIIFDRYRLKKENKELVQDLNHFGELTVWLSEKNNNYDLDEIESKYISGQICSGKKISETFIGQINNLKRIKDIDDSISKYKKITEESYKEDTGETKTFDEIIEIKYPSID